MPFYLFQNSETEEIREIFFHMADEKVYNGEDNKEPNIWKRCYLSPNAAINSQPLDPYSKKDFAKWVGNGEKKITIGDMMSHSESLSKQREEKDGTDFVKEKMFDKYKEKTGKISPLKLREERVKKLKKQGIHVDYSK
jgi:hypothetical protein